MLNNQLAKKYAQAIFELAQEQNDIDPAEQQLRDIVQTIAGNEDLHQFLYHPRVLPGPKKETMAKLFGADVQPYLLHFLYLLLDRRRETLLPAIVDEFTRQANGARNICEAQVISAMPLTAGQEQALADKLSRISGKTINLKTQIDRSLIGGLVVQIGDKRIDGSVARQMESLGERLRQTRLTTNGVTNER